MGSHEVAGVGDAKWQVNFVGEPPLVFCDAGRAGDPFFYCQFCNDDFR